MTKASLLLILTLLPRIANSESPPASNVHRASRVSALSGRVLLSDPHPVFLKSLWPAGDLSNGGMSIGDIDGDGKADLISMTVSEKVWVAFSNGRDFGEARSISGLDPDCRFSWNGSLREALTADLDGDGAKELIGTRRDKRGVCAAKFDAGHFSTTYYQSDIEKFSELNSALAANIGVSELAGPFYYLYQPSETNVIRWTLLPGVERLSYSAIERFPRGVGVLAQGDLNGDLLPDIIGRAKLSERILRCPLAGKEFSCQPWLHFPVQTRNLSLYSGDFNGDGRTDVFLPGDGISGTWLGLSGVITGIEQEVRGPDVPGAKRTFQVGDVDGDGSDELVKKDPAIRTHCLHTLPSTRLY